MNRLAIAVLISAVALGASAQTPTADPVVQSDPAAQADVNATDANAADVTVITGNEKTNDRNCLRETGSHVSSKNRKECINANGTAYSRADIDRTGATDLAEALRRLSPSVSITHN